MALTDCSSSVELETVRHRAPQCGRSKSNAVLPLKRDSAAETQHARGVEKHQRGSEAPHL
ncbi:hypothetical protein XdyCFBP7245_18825 [Xanthomonas dyei]|uniref:Uncharacterized protein n=1 Tax=Xanthomonas dyei TaxID=743699 RepID=A0A2S7BYF8_9XANT|nr:hypothetical protein XdyCFBP7245_18825 [Xanthomonas dyei]